MLVKLEMYRYLFNDTKTCHICVFSGLYLYREIIVSVGGRCLPNHTRVSPLSKNTLGYVSGARQTLWHVLVVTSYSHLV